MNSVRSYTRRLAPGALAWALLPAAPAAAQDPPIFRHPRDTVLEKDRPRITEDRPTVTPSEQVLVGREVQINSADPLLALSDTASQTTRYLRNHGGDLLFGSVIRGFVVGGVDINAYSDGVVFKQGGNVGIGLGEAPHRLSIRRGPLWTSNGWTGALDLENGAALAWHANQSGQRFGMGHTNGGFHFFRTGSDPARSDQPAHYDLVIRDDGTVDVKVLSADVLEITGADLAERFELSAGPRGRPGTPEPSEPGMVVAIDAQHPGKLAVSDREYDRRVAGVISGASAIGPGLVLGRQAARGGGGQPVALTGRVYCWADTSGGPIRPGDLLTTSNRRGHARRVTDHAQAQGAILGKAMGTLEEGTGLVLILVTLQ
jgi:hypothetical protein